MSSSSGSKGSNEYGSSSNTNGSHENVGTSLIPMAIPVRSYIKDEAVLSYPKSPTKYKERVIIKMAREFGLMPAGDIKAPELTKTVLGAQDGGMIFFTDALKAELRWPLHPFFIHF